MIQTNPNARRVVLPETCGDELRALREKSRHLLVELEQLCAESDADNAAIGHIREAMTDIGNRIAELKVRRVRR